MNPSNRPQTRSMTLARRPSVTQRVDNTKSDNTKSDNTKRVDHSQKNIPSYTLCDKRKDILLENKFGCGCQCGDISETKWKILHKYSNRKRPSDFFNYYIADIMELMTYRTSCKLCKVELLKIMYTLCMLIQI